MNYETNNGGFIARLTLLIGNEKPYPWAARIGITQATFNRMWKDGVAPKADTLLLISKGIGCSIDWLLTGEGEMKRQEAAQAASGKGFAQDSHTAGEQAHNDAPAAVQCGDGVKQYSNTFVHDWIEEELQGKSISEVMSIAVKIKAVLDGQ